MANRLTPHYQCRHWAAIALISRNLAVEAILSYNMVERDGRKEIGITYIPVPNSIKVSLDMSYGGQQVAMTQGWTKASAIEGSDLIALVEALEGWAGDYLFMHLSSAITLISINATDISSESGASYTKQLLTPLAGSVTGNATPNNCAAVVTARTALRGRSYRGRNYIPGIPYSYLLSMVQLTTAAMAYYLADFYALFVVETGVGMWRAVHSRYHDKAPRITGVSERIWTYSIDAYLDSQRRRLAGRGI